MTSYKTNEFFFTVGYIDPLTNDIIYSVDQDIFYSKLDEANIIFEKFTSNNQYCEIRTIKFLDGYGNYFFDKLIKANECIN